jgi:hypothetical protein
MVAAARLLLFAAALVAATAVSPFVRPATAGCGCDHPPPAYAPVMPPFASPGRSIRIYAEGGAKFKPFTTYTVTFQPATPGLVTTLLPVSKRVMALRSDWIALTVPSNLKPGPIALRVKAPGFEVQYAPHLFTALPLARQLPNSDASILISGLDAAVSMDGTLLVPIDLTGVLDPIQFALMLTNVPLGFTPEDVTFYNADGVDLSLFTLHVNDPTTRQWGSYFGWEVEDDAAMRNVVYDDKVVFSPRPGQQSDLLTYWRHEFHTYETAHERDGSHFVDANGLHPDGSMHIDHNRLILAITGKLRDPAAPTDATRAQPLAPGKRMVDLLATAAVSEHPIEPDVMAARAQASPAYEESLAALNGTVSGLTGNTDPVPVSQGPLGLGTTVNNLTGGLLGN